MINDQLVNFIKQQIDKGINKETISKELLSSDWTFDDIEEGFNAINIVNQNKIEEKVQIQPQFKTQPEPQPEPKLESQFIPQQEPQIEQKNESQFIPQQEKPNPIVFSDFHTTSNWVDHEVGKNSHDIRNVLLIVFGLLLFVGTIFGYIFRNEIPIINELLNGKSNLEPKLMQESNTQSQIQNTDTSKVQPELNPEIVVVDTNQDEAIFDRLNNALIDGSQNIATDIDTLDCGNDISCFIDSANNCKISKVVVIQKNKTEPTTTDYKSDGTYLYKIIGKENDNCVFEMKVSNVVFKPTVILPDKSLKIMNDYAKIIEGTETICKFNLDKKMGDILNEEIINPKGNFIIDTKTSLGSDSRNITINTYKSGMICTQKSPVVSASIN